MVNSVFIFFVVTAFIAALSDMYKASCFFLCFCVIMLFMHKREQEKERDLKVDQLQSELSRLQIHISHLTQEKLQ